MQWHGVAESGARTRGQLEIRDAWSNSAVKVIDDFPTVYDDHGPNCLCFSEEVLAVGGRVGKLNENQVWLYLVKSDFDVLTTLEVPGQRAHSLAISTSGTKLAVGRRQDGVAISLSHIIDRTLFDRIRPCESRAKSDRHYMHLCMAIVTSCDHTWPCLRPLGSIRVSSTLRVTLSRRFGPSVSAVTNRSQQAARADITSQSCPPCARAAACTRIWPLERAGRAGLGSAWAPKSPVRAGPADAAGRRGHWRPAWSDSDWPRPRPRRLHAAAARNQGRNTVHATTH